MELTQAQMSRYENEGLLIVEDDFTQDEMALLKAEAMRELGEERAGTVPEGQEERPRAVNGSHLRNAVFSALIRTPQLLRPAEQLLGSRVYVHQFKINAKFAFVGERWEWHQDFTFWRDADQMREPRAVTACITLDDIYEFNGPLMFIPGSHRDGEYPVDIRDTQGEGWQQYFGADMKYKADRRLIAELAQAHGVAVPKLKRGSVMFFHPNVYHASSANMSPYDRTMVYVTYNSVENALPATDSPRPEFIAARDFTPLSEGTGRLPAPTLAEKRPATFASLG
ncbi:MULTISPECIES: phytanoyl-CoA dioxygenase family protein [Pandoraea]|uniref:phytanoyl-CoA dioxygenase family protein n=1 Tax=Pandoraea TaxID=93217 RepID=UPI001F5D8B2C|nr:MULTISPECIES: phytanoyl-CoA dioxygenase family protein [Pandoraea]MCI3208037.1 phytanoyl-CoA dioxygenase [Pandoraea sp. LA3]MDN4586066.1 phytanoyl-CoA dioxygenase [Pandoraea capi]